MINDTIKSVKGIIILNKRYLLQLRDNKKNIYFPNFWGLFGGRVDIGETFINALRREIKEELNLVVKVKQKILSTTYNMIGLKKKEN
jgi:8-oxo-dGTP diphosphatase